MKRPGLLHELVVCLLLLSGNLSGQLEDSIIEVAEGFEVTKVYSVPGETQGSWVALTVDGKGRLIAGDQKGGLFRITLEEGAVTSVEALDLEIGFVNGLTFAFGSLYAVVAEDVFQGGGLYRIRDLDADDVFDDVQFLRGFVAKGEHGPHSVVPGPGGKWLYVVSGNKTPVPDGPGFKTRVPPHWGEDDLLPRLWGPIGSEKGTTAPGGWIARTDSEGKSWELLAIGFRNAYDIAFNEIGDLFTTDADAEFDGATPWYQPTRLLHVVTGTDYGWRSGSGKWPPYFADTVPPVYEYGPGSPTGITFGYGTRFPGKYQRALFAGDWSWGRLFVSWLKPHGASYTSVTEEFMTGIPLPIADIVVNPMDGAMYFVLGGRGTTSGLYRIAYVGDEIAVAQEAISGIKRSVLEERKTLERLIQSATDEAVSVAWPYLSSEDRVLRHTARLVLEHVPAKVWKDRALTERDPIARMTSLLGLARAGEGRLLPELLSSILELDWREFNSETMLLGLRCLEVPLISMDSSETSSDLIQEKKKVRQLLESLFPTEEVRSNAELIKLLVYLGSKEVTEPAMDLLDRAATQEDMLRIILPLRLQSEGWNRSLRERFFATLGKIRGWKGGLSLSKYGEAIVEDALSTVPENTRSYFREIISGSAPRTIASGIGNRPFVNRWTLEDLLPVSGKDLEGRDKVNGRRSFASAGCFACHRVNCEGGVIGPDLSAILRRFTTRDLLEAVIEPSKVISDQYAVSVIQKTDGTQLYGKVVNYYGDSIGIQTNSLDSANIIRVSRKDIASLQPSPISSMPQGLLNSFTREDILDLLGYLLPEGLSGGL